MADARGEEELAATAHQLDAFHKTFNFCLTCRQYTCGECWNVTEGRCLTCAPIEGLEAPTHAHSAMAPGLAATNGHDADAHDDLQPDLWPEADLSQDRLARALGTEAPVADAIEDEVPTQLEVDAAADAFDAPEFESTEGMTVDEAWMAAAAAEADAVEARDVILPEPEPAAAVAADVVEATPEVGAAEDDVAAGLVDEDAPIAAAAMAAGFADDDAAPSMSALDAEEAADFEAQASAAEQDATAEAVMDPALDFDLDDAETGVAGVAPGQSLEEAIAAYEARLAAEEAEVEGRADDHSVADVAAVAAIAAVTEPDAPVALEPVADVAAEVPVEAAAVADVPVDLVAEPVSEAPAEVVAEPVAAELPVEAADVAIADEPAVIAQDDDHLLAAAAITAAVVDEPVATDEPVAAADEPEHDHAIGVAAIAAAAFAAGPHHDEPDETVVVVREPEPVAAVEPEPVAAEPEPIVAVEPEPVVAAEPEPVVAAEPEPVVAEPEPVAASAEPAWPTEPEWPAEPEPVAAEPVAAEPEPVAAGPAPRDDVVPQPTWPTTPPPEPVAAPAPTPEPAPGTAPWLMVAPEEAARPEPQWPATPAWRANARNTDAPTTLAGRTLLPQPDATDLWAASAREVLSAPPVTDAAVSATPQPCVQCGLSLSASARFCRRCGTRQA